jgi:4-hydroxybenzoate polyprenyltransferase
VRWSYGTLRRVALGLLLGALSLGLVLVVRLNRPVAVVDLLGVLLAGMVIGAARRAVTDEHLVLLDLLVAWPAVTAWVLG